MDYRALLKKYMELVAHAEGVTFISPRLGVEAHHGLTEEEFQALVAIHLELYG